MALTDVDNVDILKNDAFRVEILSLPDVVLFSQTVDLPGVILGEALRPNPNIDYVVPGEKVDFENLLVSFMVDEQLTNYLQVFEWMRQLGFPQHTDQFKNKSYSEISDIKIELLTNKMNYNTEVTFVGCFPISLSAVPLTYLDIEPTHPTATVEFQYQYMYYGSKENDFMSTFY